MSQFSSIDSVLNGLAKGEMIIVVDDPHRENEGDLVMIAEHATPEAINFMATHGRGLICLPLEPQIARTLELMPMVEDNTDLYGTAFTVSIDYDNGSTGISAFDRSETILKAVSPGAKAQDFKRPGHIFPLIAKVGGVRERRGHTEASVELAKLAGYRGAAVICEILNEDGTMARMPDLEVFARKHQLKIMTIEGLVTYVERLNRFKRLETVEMPTAYGDFKLTGFVNEKTGEHHLALHKGLGGNRIPIVRVHSECLTGDVFTSHRCDCGEQLTEAMKLIESEGCGAIIYLRQEGRGIGLPEKLKAYALQERGYNTITANVALGHPIDGRTYDVAADMLKSLGIDQLRLVTNNPDKMKALAENGLHVLEAVRTKPTVYAANNAYLTTKKMELGHELSM